MYYDGFSDYNLEEVDNKVSELNKDLIDIEERNGLVVEYNFTSGYRNNITLAIHNAHNPLSTLNITNNITNNANNSTNIIPQNTNTTSQSTSKHNSDEGDLDDI